MKFKKELLLFIAKIDEIDKEVPYTVNEPKWWLLMNDLQREAYKINDELNNIGNNG